MINKLDSCFLIVQFCYSHSYENRPNWTPFSVVAIINRTPVCALYCLSYSKSACSLATRGLTVLVHVSSNTVSNVIWYLAGRGGRKGGPITAKPHRKTYKNRNTASNLTKIPKPQYKCESCTHQYLRSVFPLQI